MAKILIVGSGGREHALAYKLHKDNHQIYVAPGNPGISQIATCVNISINDFDGLIRFCKEISIELTIVGPEEPLDKGIVDAFQKANLLIFGPRKKAAQIESSKIFSKNLMHKYNIPTAKFASFDNFEEAKKYLTKQQSRVVIKADGLAAGKGVVIPKDINEALELLKDMMCNNLFNTAGSKVVIEEFLEGEEFSLLAFVKDDLIIPMPLVQDHKRAFDNDQGLNTGGMGAYTPVNHINSSIVDKTMTDIMKPMITAMVNENCNFTGILYGGFMLTKDGVKTIEFNARFGDPETQILMLGLQTDLYEIIINLLNNKIIDVVWSTDAIVGVVLASKGYPLEYIKNEVINIGHIKNSIVFHMGTSLMENKLINTGGRVLLVASKANTLQEAINNVYKDLKQIDAKQLFYRKDIAAKGLI